MPFYRIQRQLEANKDVYLVKGPFGGKYVAKKMEEIERNILIGSTDVSLPEYKGTVMLKIPGREYEQYDLMSFVPGEPLDPNKKFEDRSRFVQVMNEVARSLYHIHQGFSAVHSDVKPDNIVMSTDRATLIDFQTAMVLGTKKGGIYNELYSPLDAISGNRTFKSDVFSFGMTQLSLIAPVEPKGVRLSDIEAIVQTPIEDIWDLARHILREGMDYKQAARVTAALNIPSPEEVSGLSLPWGLTKSAYHEYLCATAEIRPENRPTMEDTIKHLDQLR